MIDLNHVSIKYCFNCPYPDDCIATNLELCSHLKEKANEEREKYNQDMDARDKEALKKIDRAIRSGKSSVPKISKATGLGEGYIRSLMKRGKLITKKNKHGKATRVTIIGVKNVL